jgi:type IV pilus assembly protein PilX
MLKAHTPRQPHAAPMQGQPQRGIVLIMALIVLVALTLGALALTRSTYTANVIAGNLAFQQGATHSADAGIEAAVAWLENNNGKTKTTGGRTCASGPSVLDCDQALEGYLATKRNPTDLANWAAFWTSTIGPSAITLPADTAGNTVAYVIERMCSSSGDAQSAANDCTVAPVPPGSTCSGGSSCDAERVNLDSINQVYYRITVKVAGPRNTQSYVQSIVAL